MRRTTAISIAILACTLRVAGADSSVSVVEGKPVAWKLANGDTVRFFWLQHSPAAWRETVKYFEYVPAQSNELGMAILGLRKDASTTRPATLPSVEIPPNGVTFRFATNHSGYQRVELHGSDDEQIMWIVDTSDRAPRRVGCTFNRRTGTFEGEGEHLTVGVAENVGKVIEPLPSE